jgi:hypothetical protein
MFKRTGTHLDTKPTPTPTPTPNADAEAAGIDMRTQKCQVAAWWLQLPQRFSSE